MNGKKLRVLKHGKTKTVEFPKSYSKYGSIYKMNSIIQKTNSFNL